MLIPAIAIVLIGLVSLGPTPPAHASPTVVTFGDTDDSYVDSANPSTNYGTATTLSMAGTSVWGYLKFNVSVPAGNSVTAATLKLHAYSTSSYGFVVKTAGDTTWQESTLTYNNAPSVNSSPVSANSGPVTAGSDYTIDVTSLLPAHGGAATLVIQTPGSTRFSVRSKEQTATPPVLTVTYDATATSSSATDFNSTADDYISTAFPTTNYGTVNTLRISNATSKTRSFLRFNVTGTTGHVTSASLKVYVKGNQTLPEVAHYTVSTVTNDSWDESTLTNDTAPPWGSASVVTSPDLNVANVATTGGYVSADVTPLISGNGSVDMILQCDCTQSSMNFYSREDTSSRQPVLTVATDGMSSDPVLAAAGDIGCASSDANYNNDLGATGYCHQLYTSNTVLNDPLVTAVASLGDHQYDNNTPANYAAVYQPNWGRYFAKDYPATGNHEYQYPTGSPGTTDVTKMALGYYGYFLDKANGSRSLTSTGQSGDCKSACLGYYSYDLGTWHIIVLNAQCTGASGSESNYDLGTGACAAGSTQEQWLQSDLAAHTNVCTLAYWHQPRYSSGGHQNNSLYDDFWKDLYNAGAEVVLNGHDHDYERIALQKPVSSNSYGDGTLDTAFGLREFVAGTGGKNHASLGSHTVVNSEAYDNTTFGILKLTLHPGSYDWTFANESGGTPDGSFTDSGTQLCHGVTTTPIP